jgi:hypothetical protein
MDTTHPTPIVRFLRLIADTRPPQRAERDAAGTLPIRAARYCDAVTAASGWGWFVFPPLDLSLYWDGETIFWSCPEFPDWMALDDAAQYPHFSARFDKMAPPAAQGCAPPFLTRLPEPGALQIWTGLIARTAPDWSLNVRAPVNLPATPGIHAFEGILEADLWTGPLFANIRLTRTHHPIRLNPDLPLLQVQPLPRHAYANPHPNQLTPPTPDDWDSYITHIVAPNADPDRAPGRYASLTRRRRKCPAGGGM